MNQESGLTSTGKIVSALLVAALVGLGVIVLKKKKEATNQSQAHSQSGTGTANASDGGDDGFTPTQTTVPTLSPPEPYRMKDGILDVDISEYPGYAGLIVANGGTEPTENSVFFKNHGFKVRVKFSSEESWDTLNSGKVGASVTTTDVLAVLGKQFQVLSPMLISYSRGADAIIVQRDIKRLNDLKGKVVVASQFTETDFFLRYLAQEAGIGIHLLPDPNAPVEAEKINLVFNDDGEAAGDLFLAEVLEGKKRLAGVVTWAPKTTEVLEKAGNKARLLASNKNLLVISDILVCNKAFATEKPEIVAGLVEGWQGGNRQLRENSALHHGLISKAFKWTAAQCTEELQKVHFANLPENLAYFNGTIDSAGSFSSIYQSAVMAYGSLLGDAPPFERFLDQKHLQALQTAGKFADQQISLAPIKSEGGGALENDPLLTKDIRFFYEPNSSTLITDAASKEGKSNTAAMQDVSRLLRVSPGSVLLLVGHVDDQRVAEFKAQGPAFFNQMKLKAVQLSKDRAEGVRSSLQTNFKVDPSRLQTDGKGWDRPASKTNRDINRRVEIQWFTLE